MESEEGFPTRTWYGALSATGMTYQDLFPESEAIDRALSQNDWHAVIQELEKCTDLVNAVFPRNRQQSTLLHVAAERHVPVSCVEHLLHLGAFRTIRNASGRQALGTC